MLVLIYVLERDIPTCYYWIKIALYRQIWCIIYYMQRVFYSIVERRLLAYLHRLLMKIQEHFHAFVDMYGLQHIG